VGIVSVARQQHAAPPREHAAAADAMRTARPIQGAYTPSRGGCDHVSYARSAPVTTAASRAQARRGRALRVSAAAPSWSIRQVTDSIQSGERTAVEVLDTYLQHVRSIPRPLCRL
jgi:hypothetical protein